MKQITDTIMMIEPTAFGYNEQTACNNYYQRRFDNYNQDEVQRLSLLEFKEMVKKLIDIGVNVIVFKDTESPRTPDSIFPNNWISFHSDGTISIYPMYALNRREERRRDIFNLLSDKYRLLINDIQDFTAFENDNKYLEGTGSMVLDRENQLCYAALSVRTHKEAVLEFCSRFKYQPIFFQAKQNINGVYQDIYHTNVMMCVADEYSVICLDAIHDSHEKDMVTDYLTRTNKEIIEISESQKNNFAGNMLQIMGDQKYIIMSDAAFGSLTTDQISRISRYNPINHSNLETIEACGGGSARCMISEIFLPKIKLC